MLTSRARRPSERFGAAVAQPGEGTLVVCRTRGCSCTHVPGQPTCTAGCILHSHRFVDGSSRSWLNGKCSFCEPGLVVDAPSPRERAFVASTVTAEQAAIPAAMPVRQRSKWEAKFYEEEMKRKDAEKRLQRMEDILSAKRAHLDSANASTTAAVVAQHTAEQAELVWKQKYEEEKTARLDLETVCGDLEVARDAAVADKVEAEERADVAEEMAIRSRGLWVAASWRSAFDRKRRDEARATVAASSVECEQAQLACAADRQARLNAEELSRVDKREREDAEERARLDRQARIAAEQLASSETTERMALADQLARSKVDAEAAAKVAEESASLVAAAKKQAATVDSAAEASAATARDATARATAAEAQAANAALEIAQLQALLGTATTSEREAAAAQQRAQAAMAAEVETERGLREDVEARLMEANGACVALQKRLATAAKTTWQIGLLRTQVDALRKSKVNFEQKFLESLDAREQTEVRLQDAVCRTSAAEERVQRAEDEAASARAELGPLKMQAAQQLTKAEAAERRCEEELQRRIAAETERRRRVDRVRRAREKTVGDPSQISKVQKARRKKLEKGVSTYLAARLLRMPKGHTKPRFAFQVDLDVDALNHQECFLLDMGDRIYKFVGDAASAFDRMDATNFADYLEKSKNGAATVEDANEYFWKLLNGTMEDVSADAPLLTGDHVGSMVAGGVSYIAVDTGNWSRATTEQATKQLARSTE